MKCIPLPLRCVFMFYSGGKRSLSDHRPLPRCTLLESFQRRAGNFAVIGFVQKGVFFWTIPWGRVSGQTGSGHTVAWRAALALLQLCSHVCSFAHLMPCPAARQSFGAAFPWAGARFCALVGASSVPGSVLTQLPGMETCALLLAAPGCPGQLWGWTSV